MRNEEMGQFLVLNLSIDTDSKDCGQVLTWNDNLIRISPLKFASAFGDFFHFPHFHKLDDLFSAHMGLFHAEID